MLDKTFAFLTAFADVRSKYAEQDPRIERSEGVVEAMKEVKLLRSLPEIVMLAGSSRFKYAFETVSEQLVLDGRIVLGKHVFKPGADWPVDEQAKDLIHAVQFRMCDLATRLHIVNVDGYIGQDTYNLIRYAIRTDKLVTFYDGCVRLHSTGSKVTSHHFMQATTRTVEFEEAALGG